MELMPSSAQQSSESGDASALIRQWITDSEVAKLDKSPDAPLLPLDLVTATKPDWLLRWERQGSPASLETLHSSNAAQ